MFRTYTAFGVWVSEDKWDFSIDSTKGSKLLDLKDDISYVELRQIVKEEYGLDNSLQDIQLSYMLPESILEKTPNEVPPVFLTSDRQVCSFIQICKSFSARLCISITNKNIQIGASSMMITDGNGDDDINDGKKDDGDKEDDDNQIISSTDVNIKVGESYKSKDELQWRLWMLSVKYKFGWKVTKSNTSMLVVVCKNDGCSWKVRASKKDATSEYFWIRKYIDMHTCLAENRSFTQGNVSSKVVGKLVLELFGGISHGLKPRDLEKPLLKNFGLTLKYHQLWDALEHAREFLRGSPESGYDQLPKYMYKIKKANPGTICDLELDDEHRFKYLFFSLGASLKGFEFIRKVIAVDGSFLKAKFKGTFLLATAQDGDNRIYPIAFGIVDSENDASWEWFFSHLKSAIPYCPDLVFISDRHSSIAKAISKVFPTANRGICFFHLEKNIITRFGANQNYHLVHKAAKTSSVDEFTNVMNEIRRVNPNLCQYLEDADIRLWSSAHFQGNRYTITTTNIAESINGLFKEAREYPIVAFLDHVRDTLMRWFCKRREEAAKLDTELGPYAEKQIEKLRHMATTLSVCAINQKEFHVTGSSQNGVVNMDKLICSCRKFDIEKIPCVHAIAVALKYKIPAHTLSDPCYTKSYLFGAYSESIYPVQGILNDIQVPSEVNEKICLPPKSRRNKGRPKKERYQSSLDIAMSNKRPRKENKCSRCKLGGHNRATCQTPLP